MSSNTNVYLISIEGNIGSGKSTFLEHLREKYKTNCDCSCLSNNIQVVFAPEPVKEWQDIKDKNGVNILEKFYQDQEKYAFSFQMMAYISRLSILKNLIKNSDSSKPLFIITERSLFTDRYIFAKMLYDQHKISEIDYQIYLRWFDEFSIPVTHCVYLRSDPSICDMRVKKRARQGEEIPLTYLEACHTYHEQYVEMFPERLVLDADKDINRCPWVINEWLDDFDRNIIQSSN